MFRLIISLVFIFYSSQSTANTYSYENNKTNYSQTTYGGIGLIEIPTARFSNDGEFLFGISSEDPYNRLYAKVQFFPWLEAVVRYTEGEHIPYNFGSHQTWKDKGLDLKVRVLEETNTSPGIAIGLTDFGGTGAYSSEYIVASKSYRDLDFSLGLGWGRLGGVNHITNPLGWLDKDRKIRGGSTNYGGKINLKRLFSGESASIFGGVEYFTNIPNLSLKLEYDTSDYSRALGKEKNLYELGSIFELDSRINFALNYSLNVSERDQVDFSLGYVRGNTIYANIAIHSNLNFSGKPKIIMGAEKLKQSNIENFNYLNADWKKYVTDTIIWELGNAGFVTHNILFNENELAVEFSQSRFLNTSQAFDLSSRIIANNAPKNVTKITVINIDLGVETLRATIDKNKLIQAVSVGFLPEDLMEFNAVTPDHDNSIMIENEYLYPNFYWDIKPHALGTLQHQEKFYFWQLEALLHTEYSIKKGLYLTTDIGIDIANNYEDYTYHIPDGELYHVRQDRRLYLTEGKTGLRRMALDYLFEINNNLKGKVSAGYLEWMYGGIGGEILYIPDNKRWGLGIDAYWVKQRDFDQKFSFKEYETITGMLTYYRDIPFYDMRLKLGVGKFLAKDIGTHIDISRRFKTGARIGGIVALTDCDEACVGEGSFNKWIYFELPMDLFFTQSSTRGKAGYAWSPLTKGAGQRVGAGGLYNTMISATDGVESLRQKSWSVKKIFSGFSTKPSKGF